MKGKIFSAVAVAVLVFGVAGSAQAGFGTNLGNKLGNAAEDAATKAIKGAVMQPRTTCTCGASGVDAKCASKLAAEIGGKQMIGGASGENHSYWLKCDVFGETKMIADNCVSGLRNTFSTVGASRTSFNAEVGGSKEVKCSVELY